MSQLLYPTTVNAVSKQLNANYTAADAVITLTNTTSIQNKPGVCLINRVDTNGTLQPTANWTYIEFTATSGATLTGCTAISGDQDQALGKVVEFVSDVTQQQRILDTLVVGHNDDGTHKASLTFTTPTLTSPVLNIGVSGTAVKDEDDMASNSATALATQQSIKAYVDNGTWLKDSIFRQAIINGNFDVWQRGTSVALTAADGYTADRWYAETATATTDKTVSRQDGTGVNGSYYCARVLAAQDVDALVTFSQALESQDSIKFRGGKVTLSFYARGGAEFVADNATLVSKIVTGKGTDQKVLAFTTSADAVSQNNTLTTSWVKFTCTTSAVIASDITQIGVSFSFTHAGSGVTTNYFEVTQVQLCAGSVALPFQPKSFEEELSNCERYCQAFVATQANGTIGALGVAFNTAGAQLVLPLRRMMRIVPTLTATATDWKIGDSASSTDVTTMVLASSINSTSSVVLEVAAASVTQFRPYFLIGDGTTNRTLILSAEL